jgi:UDP-N-acetylmuramate dehydrogenase
VIDELARVETILRAACGERLRASFSMAPLTTFRIGGPASLYLEAESERDLVAAGDAMRETGIPVVVIGKGSNVLVSDDGFPGLVLRLGKAFRWAARDGDRLSAGAAMPLPALAGVALAHSLSGLEFGVAIPASLGGAVKMNAGAHGHDLAEVLETVHVFSLREGRVNATAAIDVDFDYRGSSLGDEGVVVAATARLRSGERDQIRRHMDDAREWRRRTQPLAEPNCGSVFKNPPGEHAARLVEEAGAKGLSIGGATVSPKHANFIVAAEGARASDVAALIGRVQELVADRFDVRLEREVRLVGSFDLAQR